MLKDIRIFLSEIYFVFCFSVMSRFLAVITARQRSWGKVMLSKVSVSQSVQEGWVSLVPRPFQRVWWVSLVPGPLGWVCLVPGPFQGWLGKSGQVGMSGWMGISRGWVPPTDMIGKWTVRILLECLFVQHIFPK